VPKGKNLFDHGGRGKKQERKASTTASMAVTVKQKAKENPVIPAKAGIQRVPSGASRRKPGIPPE
jgi:hypothetical protein